MQLRYCAGETHVPLKAPTGLRTGATSCSIRREVWKERLLCWAAAVWAIEELAGRALLRSSREGMREAMVVVRVWCFGRLWEAVGVVVCLVVSKSYRSACGRVTNGAWGSWVSEFGWTERRRSVWDWDEVIGVRAWLSKYNKPFCCLLGVYPAVV